MAGMEIRVWGVRGSLPTPLTGRQLREKLEAVLAAATPADLAGPAAISSFLDRTPIAATHGGNTSCIEVRLADQTLILDAGSGIRHLSAAILADGRLKDHRLRVLFTHFHWDHICGLPFFAPLYIPDVGLEFWSWREDVERLLRIQMADAHFPIKWDDLKSRRSYQQFDLGRANRLGSAEVRLLQLNHPDGAYGYRIDAEGGSVCYLTDTEVSKTPNEFAARYAAFVEGSQVVFVDAMYGFVDYHNHYDWGHSSVFTWIDFFKESNIRELVIFHHDPQAGDPALLRLLDDATKYRELVAPKARWKLSVAQEGMRWGG